MEKLSAIVIDDDIGFANLITEILSLNECEASVATSAKMFHEHYINHPVDLITMDLSMPGMDGFEFIDQLAEIDCKSCIILISGYEQSLLAAAETLAKRKGLNVIAALRKPFDVEEFETILTDLKNQQSE